MRLALLLGLLGAIAAVPPAASAQAPFGIESFTGQVFADGQRSKLDAYTNTGGEIADAYPDPASGGTGVYELAGGHPFIGVTDFSFRRQPGDGPPAGGNVASLRVDIPRGLMPNPRAFTRCTDAELADSDCPLDSQIGTEELTLYIGLLDTLTGDGDIRLRVPLYNMTPLSNPEDPPQQDVVARFGFNPAEAAEAVVALPPLLPPLPNVLPGIGAALLALHPVHIVGGVRDEPSGFGPFDYGLYFTIDHLPAYAGTPTSPGVLRSNLTFWGVPGDSAHDSPPDPHRGRSCAWIPKDSPAPACTLLALPGEPPDPSLPFLSNPTECPGTPLSGVLTVWSHPDPANGGAVASDTRADQTPTIQDVDDGLFKDGPQECHQLPFAPTLELLPDVTEPDAPSGPAVTQRVPQGGLANRDQFATSHVDDVSVTLPPGMTLNPSAANGLEACSDAQLAANVGVPGGEACPAASRIGDVRVTSPLLPPAASEPAGSTPVLTGSAYVGQPLTGDRYRLFLTVEGRMLSIRLTGSVRPDPGSGQLTATFADNPQLPFDDMTVDLRGGPRAPLATPLDCGPKTATARLAPWSRTPAATPSSSPFSISGGGCPAGFEPAFAVGTASPLAGAFSPFTASIARADRNQHLSRVRVDTPPGLAGMISRVEQCADALAASGACPAASRIGTVTTTAGAGSEPYRLSGSVYLTGPYKGAPFGMVAVIRAIAGPYDLGVVVVRESIFVDPEDAHLSVVSDPLPQILEGVPIRLRTIDVAVDEPGFVYNPTSCGPKGVRGTLHSLQGAAIGRDAGLRIDGCQALGFSPKLSLRLTGPRQMGFGKHPGIRARVTQPARQGNIGKAVVKLPRSLALDPENARSICGFEAAQRAACPPASRIGSATAVSPALNRPLSGPVYFVQGIRVDPSTGARIRTLPSLLAKLGGEVRINLRATTAVAGRKLVSSFDRVPDAPVSRFDLSLKGGKGGVIVVSARRGVCGRRQVSLSELTGHNAKRSASRVNMVKPCKRPALKIGRVRAGRERLRARGTISRAARGSIRVALRCGRTRVAKGARRPRKGRWAVTLELRGRCADASSGRLRVAYAGGGRFRHAVRSRPVNLPGGS